MSQVIDGWHRFWMLIDAGPLVALGFMLAALMALCIGALIFGIVLGIIQSFKSA